MILHHSEKQKHWHMKTQLAALRFMNINKAIVRHSVRWRVALRPGSISPLTTLCVRATVKNDDRKNILDP